MPFSPRASIADRGGAGLEFIDKPLKFRGSSWFEPSGAAILYDDFLGQVMNPDMWDTVQPQATAGTVFAIGLTAGGADGGHGGWLRGVTGTGDDDCEMVVGSRNWSTANLGNGTLVFETRLCMPVITTVNVSCGFTDAITESAAGGIVDFISDAVTAIPDDGAHWGFDTDQTTDVFRGIGSTGGTDTAFSASATGSAPPTDDPFTLRIEMDSAEVAYFAMSRIPTGYTAGDGVGPLEYRGAVAGAGTSTVAMAPYLAVTARAGTDNLALECDYIFVAAARSKA